MKTSTAYQTYNPGYYPPALSFYAAYERSTTMRTLLQFPSPPLKVAATAAEAEAPWSVLSASILYCNACNCSLGTIRPDGSILVEFRGAIVIVREGRVVCGQCRCDQPVAVSFAKTYTPTSRVLSIQ